MTMLALAPRRRPAINRDFLLGTPAWQGLPVVSSCDFPMQTRPTKPKIVEHNELLVGFWCNTMSIISRGMLDAYID